MSYIDDYIHKLNTIPTEVDRLLRLIRDNDKKVEEIRLMLEPNRKTLLQRLQVWESKRTAKCQE